ncbi:MAG TPA: transketolase, partial [Balneola sp.]|nr:transketolase [Balneola sp.]
EALAVFREEVVKGEASESTWNDLLTNYQSEQNALAQEFKSWINRELPENLESLLPVFEADEKGVASRSASGTVLNALKDVVANLFGGSADLEGSVKTNLKDEGVFNTSNSTGRNVHYGVREHG